MQISRKCKHYSDWCAAGVIADTWKSWGFMDAYTDGEIEPNATYTGDYDITNTSWTNNQTDWKYKWKYDLNDNYNYFYFSNCHEHNYTYTRYHKLYFNTSYSSSFNRFTNIHAQPPYSLDSSYPLQLSNRLFRSGNGASCISYSDYYNMFFMPLKNNGFFYNKEASGANPGYGYPAKLMTRYKQLSPYLWDLYSYRRVAGNAGAEFFISNATVIGFFNNITNKMNYITLVVPDANAARNTGGGSDWYKTLNSIYVNWDHKNGAVSTSIPYMDSTGEYTDVKENICTLIKYPYDDGALSNLFLISTCPQRKKCSFANEDGNDACGLEGKFFSFNGRNFYGFYNNLAVELPSN